MFIPVNSDLLFPAPISHCDLNYWKVLTWILWYFLLGFSKFHPLGFIFTLTAMMEKIKIISKQNKTKTKIDFGKKAKWPSSPVIYIYTLLFANVLYNW